MNQKPEIFAIGSPVWPGLSKLAEEAGETLQVIGKLMGTGGDVAHWDGSNLRERLVEEIADLLAACAFVISENDLDDEAIRERSSKKLQQFLIWHEEGTK